MSDKPKPLVLRLWKKEQKSGIGVSRGAFVEKAQPWFGLPVPVI